MCLRSVCLDSEIRSTEYSTGTCIYQYPIQKGILETTVASRITTSIDDYDPTERRTNYND
jgi:hypothetical protein